MKTRNLSLLKNIFKPFIALFFVLCFTNTLFAVILTQSVVDDYITKEQTIRNYVSVYILETADIPDKTELSTYFNLNTSLFTNLYGEINQLDYTINSANSLVLNYPIYSQHMLISTENKTLYLHSTKQNPLTVITADYSSNTTPFDGKTINVLSFVKNLMSNETAGIQTPINPIYTDWYYPNGDGTFKRYSKNSSGSWVLTDFNSNVSVLSFNESTFNKNEVCKNDDIALVTNTNSMVEYICIEGKWYEKNSISENDQSLFDGYSTLHNLVCTMWTNVGGSVVHDIVVHPFTGTKTNFTKFDDSDGVHEGYWISDDNTHVVTKNMRDLIHYRAKYGTQTTGYMCLNNTVIYAKWLSMNGTTQWFYIPQSYSDMYSHYKTNILNFNDNNNYHLSWNMIDTRDTQYKQFFRQTPLLATPGSDIHYSQFQFNGTTNNVTNTLFQISADKSYFTSKVDNTRYLTELENCGNLCFSSVDSLFKPNGNTFYGDVLDTMFVWYYDINNNQFVDAKKIINAGDIYTLNYNATFYNNDIYYKKADINGNTCYQKQNGDWVTDELKVIPIMYLSNVVISGQTVKIPNFPLEIDCKNVTFDASDIIMLNNRTQMVNWVNATVNIEAHVTGINDIYQKKAQVSATDNDTPDYWMNTTENLSYRTRLAIPFSTNTSKKYLTLYLGKLANDLDDTVKNWRFSANGFKYNLDANFYQWFVANTTKSVNNMIDGDCTNENYTSNACYLTYTNNSITKNFKFNSISKNCEIPINNDNCPIVKNINNQDIQTVYNNTKNKCEIVLENGNEYFCPTNLKYSTTTKMCENNEIICPSGYSVSGINCIRRITSSCTYTPEISVRNPTLSCKVPVNGGSLPNPNINQTTMGATVSYWIQYQTTTYHTGWLCGTNLGNFTLNITIYNGVLPGQTNTPQMFNCVYYTDSNGNPRVRNCDVQYTFNGFSFFTSAPMTCTTNNCYGIEVSNGSYCSVKGTKKYVPVIPSCTLFNNLDNSCEYNLNTINISNYNYDTSNDAIYYTPNNTICQNTKMSTGLQLPTPYYSHNDGNCYSELGNGCYDAGFMAQQSKVWP